MLETTMTLSAQMVISKTESGMDLVQVLPDNPREGLVKPFNGTGHAKLLNREAAVAATYMKNRN